MPPAAALFDNDGLTLDTEPAWTRAETVLFARYGQTFTMDHKRALLGSSPRESAAKMEVMLGQPGHRLSAELYELAIAEVSNGTEPRPGAVALLAALAEAGVPVALVSNAHRRFINAGLRAADLVDAFAVIVSADDVDNPKPAPDAYLHAARALGVEATDCAVFEDSPTGLAAGKASGAFTIGVPGMPGIELDADLVVDSLAHPDVFEALGLPAPA